MTDKPLIDRPALGLIYTEGLPTLAQYVGDFLAEAERLYGPRNRDFTFIGVEMVGDRPMTWFPNPPERRQVSILLSECVALDRPRAIWQLAHEVVHLLAPAPGMPSLVIEEGAAGLFQAMQAARLGIDIAATGKYAAAATLVANIVQADPDVIRKARAIEPTFSAMTPALLESVGVSPTLAPALTAPFSTWRP